VAINDLCKRYSVDLAALSRSASMDWDDIATLARDPLVTIGSATVNLSPALAIVHGRADRHQQILPVSRCRPSPSTRCRRQGRQIHGVALAQII